MPFGDDKKADAIIAKAIAKAEEGDTALGFTGSPAAGEVKDAVRIPYPAKSQSDLRRRLTNQ